MNTMENQTAPEEAVVAPAHMGKEEMSPEEKALLDTQVLNPSPFPPTLLTQIPL
jgi:hypothetical protein